MRIFLVLASSPNAALASSIWRANLHDPLVAMGHDVVLFEEGVHPLFDLPPDAPSTREPRARFSQRFLEVVRAAHAAKPLDLVLTYVSDSHLEPAAIETVRDGVAPVVNFFCNNVHQFHLARRTAPFFTRNLVPEREALAHYRAVGAKPVFFPMAANPDLYRPLERPLRYGVAFAGQRYGERTTHLLALLEAGVDAHAFGPGWEGAGPLVPAESAEARGVGAAAVRLMSDSLRGRLPWRALADRAAWRRLRARFSGALHGPVDDAAYVALFSESRVNLGFVTLGETHRTLRPLKQVRLREFEATMAGGFYMTGHLDELGEHYVLGREIETYRSRDELVDKCRFYLANESAREAVRRAGHERALRDHTWKRRFETLFDQLRREGVLGPAA